MAKPSKRVRAIQEKVQVGKLYPISEAIALLKEFSSVKFTETVDVAVNLGIDPRKSDRQYAVQPHCLTAQARPYVWLYLLKVILPKRPRLPAPISSEWKTWLSRSKPVIWILMW